MNNHRSLKFFRFMSRGTENAAFFGLRRTGNPVSVCLLYQYKRVVCLSSFAEYIWYTGYVARQKISFGYFKKVTFILQQTKTKTKLFKTSLHIRLSALYYILRLFRVAADNYFVQKVIFNPVFTRKNTHFRCFRDRKSRHQERRAQQMFFFDPSLSLYFYCLYIQALWSGRRHLICLENPIQSRYHTIKINIFGVFGLRNLGINNAELSKCSFSTSLSLYSSILYIFRRFRVAADNYFFQKVKFNPVFTRKNTHFCKITHQKRICFSRSAAHISKSNTRILFSFERHQGLNGIYK